MASQPARTDRIPSVRVQPRYRELVDAAAESCGQSTTGFTRDAVLEAARRELRERFTSEEESDG